MAAVLRMEKEFGDTREGAKLRAYLATLPESMALKLLAGLERAMIAGGDKGLPVDFIRETIRPALRSLEGRRPGFATAQRLFCLPFEDVLVNERRGGKIRGIVERASIQPLWDVLRHDLLPDTFSDLSARVSRHILKQDKEALGASLSVMRRSAAAALLEAARHADENAAYRETMIERLGGAAPAADARDMAYMLSLGDDLLNLQGRLPFKAGDLDDAGLRALREAYERALEDAPDAALYVPLAAMGRLAKPWQILRLLKVLQQGEPNGAGEALGARLTERLFAEMEGMAAGIAAHRPGVTSLDVVADETVWLANMSKGFSDEAALVRLTGWEERLFGLRQQVSGVIGDHLARLERDLHLALPRQTAGIYGHGVVFRADLMTHVDAARAEKVRAQLCFVLETWHRADALGIAQLYRDMKNMMDEYLTRYREALVNELRLAQPKPAKLPDVVELTGELTSLLDGEEAGEIFRRRLRVALQETA